MCMSSGSKYFWVLQSIKNSFFQPRLSSWYTSTRKKRESENVCKVKSIGALKDIRNCPDIHVVVIIMDYTKAPVLQYFIEVDLQLREGSHWTPGVHTLNTKTILKTTLRAIKPRRGLGSYPRTPIESIESSHCITNRLSPFIIYENWPNRFAKSLDNGYHPSNMYLPRMKPFPYYMDVIIGTDPKPDGHKDQWKVYMQIDDTWALYLFTGTGGYQSHLKKESNSVVILCIQ